MKQQNKYNLVHRAKAWNIKEMDYSSKESYRLRYNRETNGINVKDICIFNSEFREKIIDRKIANKFKTLLELIASICESDEDPSSGLMFALNEIERFKRELINKYVRHLNDKQIKLLDKKIKVIEEEVKTRMYQYNEMLGKKKDEEMAMETHHRR